MTTVLSHVDDTRTRWTPVATQLTFTYQNFVHNPQARHHGFTALGHDMS